VDPIFPDPTPSLSFSVFDIPVVYFKSIAIKLEAFIGHTFLARSRKLKNENGEALETKSASTPK
jgi:hypothetical protein